MAPETRYAKSDDASIAYQVVGDGEHDIVWVPGFISNVESSVIGRSGRTSTSASPSSDG
jgi:hypothetical protein